MLKIRRANLGNLIPRGTNLVHRRGLNEARCKYKEVHRSTTKYNDYLVAANDNYHFRNWLNIQLSEILDISFSVT